MKIAFVASPEPGGQRALKELSDGYGQAAVAEADFIVALGGDHMALEALHDAVASRQSRYTHAHRQLRRSSLHSLRTDDSTERLQAAVSLDLPVLQAEIKQVGGHSRVLFAINEIVLGRQVLQRAKLKVAVHGEGDPRSINGDGLMLTTPIGSTALNRSHGGPLLTLGSSLLALTGNAIAIPPAWCPVILSDHAILDVQVIEAAYRPVQILTVSETVPNISRVRLFRSPDRTVTLLVDREAQSRLCTPFGRQC
ncbi:diacylglycerol kinase catalytic domain-containing protein [Sinorhizobium meliloti]|uniref:ATP-NAD kinase n=1 Tax=Rhizobium meliloti TaxID=382 RepID=UPI000FD19AF4|nr:ATP-NAD kinase [Sinorhizobium meliloti]MQW29822.1 ATP-NAD kinase [Sinorhizobium meliloti]RVJ64330.1 ATP-NAD kinase [Sinorhizobium meliloti]